MTKDLRRPTGTAAEFIQLALKLARGECHSFYGTSVVDVLLDAMLAEMNERSADRDRIAYLESRRRRAISATGNVWQLVFAAGKRKTMRTVDVRAALEAAS